MKAELILFLTHCFTENVEALGFELRISGFADMTPTELRCQTTRSLNDNLNRVVQRERMCISIKEDEKTSKNQVKTHLQCNRTDFEPQASRKCLRKPNTLVGRGIAVLSLEIVCRLLVVLHRTIKVDGFGLVELCDGLMVFGSHREAAHVRKSFSADDFLKSHRKKANLETLRDDLGVYLKVLRSAMIELINKDYADFVNLSSNLIGLDKAINGIQLPLGQLREEVLQVKLSLEEAMGDVSSLLEQRRELRAKKRSLQSLTHVHSSLNKLRELLKLHSEDKPVLPANLVERAASEYNQLQFNISKCQQHLDTAHKQQAEKILTLLTSSLNVMFLENVRVNNSDVIARCLRIYVSLDKAADVEALFRKEVVAPVLRDVISEVSLNSDPRGVQGVYSRVLAFLETHMKELLEIPKVQGFNFLVNSYWPEVEHRLETDLSSIFAPGNPEMFYQTYCETVKFLRQLERHCRTQAGAKVLRNHPQYIAFLHHWNLPVYFQIRQEIGGSLEATLSQGITKSLAERPSEFHLLPTASAWECLLRCWADGVFLRELAHRFWKLSLQIIARYYTWIEEVWEEVDSIDESKQQLLSRLPIVTQFILGEVSSQSLSQLRQVNDIPRLFRRTNRDIPTKPCPYVGAVLAPPLSFHKAYREVVGAPQLQRWLTLIFSAITQQFYSSVNDVLTSVQKTEESLRRLKKVRDRLSTTTPSEGKGLGDDDKIRQQLVLDVQYFCEGVESVDVKKDDVDKLLELLNLVEAARSKSDLPKL
uniref:Conserved oligomeric Golgi complex subunit 2 n=1 Tax=Timema shepardi TaxID=629360 RepID=A0A7R9FVD3_TIMSH|nr:unnamed protein product [Timema shepardi]